MKTEKEKAAEGLLYNANHDSELQDEMKRAGESEELRFGATRTVGDVLGGKMIFNYLEMYPNCLLYTSDAADE